MKRLFVYLTRVLGIDVILGILAELTKQNGILIEQNDEILKLLTAEPVIVDPTAGIQFVTHSVSHGAICSRCACHVARFTVEDQQIVCANCAPKPKTGRQEVA